MLRTRSTLLSVTALSFLSTLAFAGGAKSAAPAAQHQGGEAKPAQEASAAKRVQVAPLDLPVTGATTDTIAKVVTALQGITHASPVEWKCPSCAMTQAAKGECPKCKKDLIETSTTTKVASDVKGDAGKGVLAVTLAPSQWIELSEIERAARAAQVTLRREALVVPAYSRLYVSAPSDSKEAKGAIEKALTESKLFSAASVHHDDAHKRFVVLVEGVEGKPTLAMTASAIEKLGDGYKLDDLAWTAPCEKCVEGGHALAACKGCWRDAHKPAATQPRG